MIDEDGSLRCDGCHKKFAERIEGRDYRLFINCERCKRFNIFETKPKYQSHKLFAVKGLTKV